MSLWTIKAYYLEGGTCPVLDWYTAQEPEVQAAFDATLATLVATEDWEDTKQFKALKRDHAGLGEIRFKLEGKPLRRFRPVGIWPPTTEHQFILLLGCGKDSRGVYDPPDAFTLAIRYKRDFGAGIGEVHDYR